MKHSTSAQIRGIGTALPQYKVSQEDACSMASVYSQAKPRRKEVLQELYRRTGIDSRSTILANEPDADRQKFYLAPDFSGNGSPGTRSRMAKFEDAVIPLAREACLDALADAGTSAGQITHLVTVSCTGFFAPGLDIGLISSLELAADVGRFNLGFMGCHGALNALRLCQSLVLADANARVLMCCAELCSLHYQYGSQPDDIVANSIFADGAAAVVISAADESAAGRYALTACHLKIVQNSLDAMTWKIGDHGFNMTLKATVPDLICEFLPDWLENCLQRNQMSISEIKSWAVHPGGPRILDAVEQSLGLTAQDLSVSRQILKNCGNMSSPTVLFILKELSRQVPLPAPCLLLAFGPGLTMESALLT